VKKISTSDKIYIKQSEIANAGRGVYAKSDIKKGEVIEVCPIIEISEHDTSNLNEGILITYLYFFGESREKALVALGFGSIYNHTYSPNSEYKIDEKEGTITFIATSDIKKDSEITVNYNGVQKNADPLWFDDSVNVD
jgi:uncharacterized protein